MMKTTMLVLTLVLVLSRAALAQTADTPPADPVAMPRTAASTPMGNLSAQEVARLKARQARMSALERKATPKTNGAKSKPAKTRHKTKRAKAGVGHRKTP